MTRARTVAEGWVPLTHGIPSAYNRGCRCEECRAGHALRIRSNGANERHRKANYSARVIVDGEWYAPDREGRHGERDTYNRYGCRCTPCRDAQVAYMCTRPGARAA